MLKHIIVALSVAAQALGARVVVGSYIDSSNRIQASPESIHITHGKVLVAMKPSDGDGLNHASKYDGRQRDELSVLQEDCVATVGATARYSGVLGLPSDPGWSVGGASYYHFVQVKSSAQDRPLFTIGDKRNALVIYTCDHGVHQYLGPMPWRKSIKFSVKVQVFRKGVQIQYTVNGRQGKYYCQGATNRDDRVYMKVGQYRSYPNTIDITTKTSYDLLSCHVT